MDETIAGQGLRNPRSGLVEAIGFRQDHAASPDCSAVERDGLQMRNTRSSSA
ncbi:hypothetical protein ACFY5D_09330 [Paeniglutamicibacter sp. NPDC012692]|uniref:hypothetical protein n=1 Tax=Paeniglutamicibacter sp. NPDC012692 TaxID=3364388 RepID=UPI0036AA6093